LLLLVAVEVLPSFSVSLRLVRGLVLLVLLLLTTLLLLAVGQEGLALQTNQWAVVVLEVIVLVLV
jgi:hypothetical protein